jgi:hypothetical protein
MPGALFGALFGALRCSADKVGNGETSVIAGRCDGTGFRRGGFTPPPAEAEDERLRPTPDPAFAGSDATDETLARGWVGDTGWEAEWRFGWE